MPSVYGDVGLELMRRADVAEDALRLAGGTLAVRIDEHVRRPAGDGDPAAESGDDVVLDLVAAKPVEQVLDEALLAKRRGHPPVVRHHASSNRIGWAPCQRTSSPIAWRCSTPSTTVA